MKVQWASTVRFGCLSTAAIHGAAHHRLRSFRVFQEQFEHLGRLADLTAGGAKRAAG
jgi:hypothetical protein